MSKALLGRQRQDHETETLVAQPRASCFDEPYSPELAHTLRAEGFDAGLADEDPVQANEERSYSTAGNNPRPRNVVAYGIRSDATRDGHAKTPGPDAEGNVRLRDPGMGVSEEIAPTLDAARPHAVAIAFTDVANTLQTEGARRPAIESTMIGVDLQNAALRAPGEAGTICAAQDRGNRGEAVTDGFEVRRLTPLECERLQGLPDSWTLVPYRSGRRKKASLAKDAPRYKAIGNGIARPVLEWVGRRIEIVDRLLTERADRG